MGTALIHGWLAAGITAATNIRVLTASPASAQALHDHFGVIPATDIQNATIGADYIILAVKPFVMPSVLPNVADAIPSGAVIITVAAGIPISSYEAVFGAETPIVRAMPNTPSVLGLGLTGISKGSQVSDQQLSQASKLFETVGRVLVVPEDKIDALSTISGSGPAYVFYFAEKLITAAKNLGFTQQEAELMVKETFLGSATLLANSTLSAQELRSQVSSPNGTTMQATAVFDQANLEKIFSEATQAALARAIELGRI